jgi:4-hydroxy-tetrahydrodipicolinate synthase
MSTHGGTTGRLHGIVPPLPTPLTADRSAVDVDALVELVDHHLEAGVHGLWVLGTTARFDLLRDEDQRVVAEAVARQAAGRVPLVLNVPDLGTARTLARARMFDDLPYDYYAALPPWYQPMTAAELTDYFHAVAEGVSRPLLIYNAPWVCNQLGFDHLRKLAEHPRIVGCKDVTPVLGRAMSWTPEEKAALDFSYLHGTDAMGTSTAMGADGFVSSLSNLAPALAVATYEAAAAGDSGRAFRLQTQFLQLSRAVGFGPSLACLDAAGRHLGLFRTILPPPLRALDEATAARVVVVFEAVGTRPEGGPRKRAGQAARVEA